MEWWNDLYAIWVLFAVGLLALIAGLMARSSAGSTAGVIIAIVAFVIASMIGMKWTMQILAGG